jgi:hypothetical protein
MIWYFPTVWDRGKEVEHRPNCAPHATQGRWRHPGRAVSKRARGERGGGGITFKPHAGRRWCSAASAAWPWPRRTRRRGRRGRRRALEQIVRAVPVRGQGRKRRSVCVEVAGSSHLLDIKTKGVRRLGKGGIRACPRPSPRSRAARRVCTGGVAGRRRASSIFARARGCRARDAGSKCCDPSARASSTRRPRARARAARERGQAARELAARQRSRRDARQRAQAPERWARRGGAHGRHEAVGAPERGRACARAEARFVRARRAVEEHAVLGDARIVQAPPARGRRVDQAPVVRDARAARARGRVVRALAVALVSLAPVRATHVGRRRGTAPDPKRRQRLAGFSPRPLRAGSRRPGAASRCSDRAEHRARAYGTAIGRYSRREGRGRECVVLCKGGCARTVRCWEEKGRGLVAFESSASDLGRTAVASAASRLQPRPPLFRISGLSNASSNAQAS